METRGVDISGATEQVICQSLFVNELVTQGFQEVAGEMSKQALAGLILSESDTEYYVVDKNRNLTGVITFSDAKSKILNPVSVISLTAKEFLKPPVSVLDVDDTLDQALQLFESTESSAILVTESHQTMKLAGVIRLRDAILSYNQPLLRLRWQEHGET